MYNHAPHNYICPICLGLEGVEDEHTMIKKADLVYRDALSAVFVNSKCVGNRPGHLIVVPTAHFENLYDLPESHFVAMLATIKKMALALKEVTQCDGITLMQNNEPVGDQHAFHFHLHVFPRFSGDKLHASMNNPALFPFSDRVAPAKAIKEYLNRR